MGIDRHDSFPDDLLYIVTKWSEEQQRMVAQADSPEDAKLAMSEVEITAIAKSFMGEPALSIAWFALAIVVAYVFTLYAGFTGLWPAWLAFLVASYLVYMAYTPLHESVHQNICGRDKRYRWLNDAVGHLVGNILGFSFTVHKWAHRVHHQSTNDPGADPDHVFKGNTLYDTLVAGVLLVGNEYRFFFRDVYPQLDSRRKAIVLAEIAAFLSWRLLLAIWFPLEVLVFCVLTGVVGVTWLVMIFAWLVHIPFDETERYRDTSVYLLPKSLERIGSWLWLGQNYHGIHHLFPRIPFFRYDQVFEQIEPGMRERGAPVHRLWH